MCRMSHCLTLWNVFCRFLTSVIITCGPSLRTIKCVIEIHLFWWWCRLMQVVCIDIDEPVYKTRTSLPHISVYGGENACLKAWDLKVIVTTEMSVLCYVSYDAVGLACQFKTKTGSFVNFFGVFRWFCFVFLNHVSRWWSDPSSR